ncbi:MAG TPA: hypothetical protein VI457_02105 [Methylococcaceae bacterium]|nr:hypothetical protein [Methylococcaceae bacterium]
MPMLIEHIDAIARKKQRDVLYVEFHPDEDGFERNYDHGRDPLRQQVIEWLEANHIGWFPCAPFASEEFMCPYLGQIYLDVPFSESDPVYQKVRDYLEHPDGSMRYPTVRFYVLPLAVAIKNAHHDEPRFWEQWAKKF